MTVLRHLLERARNHGEATAYRWRDGKSWSKLSWRDLLAEVRAAARAMLALGLGPGDRVAIRGSNRRQWVVSALGCQLAGGVVVGLYHTAPASQVRELLDHSGACLALIEHADATQLVDPAARSALRTLVTFDASHGGVPSWQQLLRTGDGVDDAELDARTATIDGDTLAAIVYTSGTTGLPKGVMLRHANLLWAARTFADLGKLGPYDSLVSYLPLAHIVEQIATLYLPLVSGHTVWLCPQLDRLAETLREVQPTLMFGVPRVWETMREGVLAKLASASLHRRWLFEMATGLGRGAAERRARGADAGVLHGALERLAERKVLAPVRNALGLGRVRWALSGAAPIHLDTLHFFQGLGVTLYEGLGLTETTAPAVHNLPGFHRPGTVGLPLPGVELKLASDGEILLRGPNLFAGYFRDPEATAAAFSDGWFCSGDLGSVDADGYLRIVGRKKELIITSGGKNVAPGPIERALERHEAIAQALVIGDRRPFMTALLWPARPDTEESAIAAVVDAVNGELPRAEQIRAHRLVDLPLAIETGELTATLKLRRQVVEARFADLIEAMYREHGRGDGAQSRSQTAAR